MKLSAPTPMYDGIDQASARRQIEDADKLNYKKGQDVIVTAGQRLIQQDSVTSDYYRITVVSGVLTLTLRGLSLHLFLNALGNTLQLVAKVLELVAIGTNPLLLVLRQVHRDSRPERS